jgi:hypothetical protein
LRISINGSITSPSLISPSLTSTTTGNDIFKLYHGEDEINDFPLFIERLLTANDFNFPVIVDFLCLNGIVSSDDLCKIYANIGFTLVTDEIMNDSNARWIFLRNLAYLKDQKCDLNLELLNFLRSLTFGGKLIKHGSFETNARVIQMLLPFCTDFFHNECYWRKIRYFCCDTIEVIDALRFLIVNYGTEENLKYLHTPQRDAFTLKHLARNAVRENLYCRDKSNCNVARYYKLCRMNLPTVIFKYINFIGD